MKSAFVFLYSFTVIWMQKLKILEKEFPNQTTFKTKLMTEKRGGNVIANTGCFLKQKKLTNF